jgi:hypothetical protein
VEDIARVLSEIRAAIGEVRGQRLLAHTPQHSGKIYCMSPTVGTNFGLCCVMINHPVILTGRVIQVACMQISVQSSIQ